MDVKITNPAYLPKMSLSEWNLFGNKDRYSLFKQSELMVNNLNANIAKISTENENLIKELAKARELLEQTKNNVKLE